MKKFFSLLLIFAFLLSSFSTIVFAVKGYENQGFSLEIPEELKQDKTFAFENGYVDYWHSDKYEIEVALWNSENPIAVGPVAGEKICYDIPNGQIKFSKNENKDVEINLLKGTHISGTLKYEDVSVDYHRYLFEKDGKHYNISFFLRDSDYKHYIDEIINSFKLHSANDMVSYNKKGFNFQLNSELVQDTSWAEEHGYIDSWKTEDEKFEFMIGTEQYYGHFGPILDEEKDDCRHFDEMRNEEYNFFTGGLGGESVIVNGLNGEYNTHSVEVDGDDNIDFIYHHYSFAKDDEVYHLTFYVHDEKYENLVDEIVNSFNIKKQNSFLSWKNAISFLVLFAVALIIVGAENKKRRNRNK